MKSLVPAVAAAVLSAAILTAQPAPPAARQVRFLPLGELPPYRQEIRDGIAYEQEPPPGSIPPRQILAGFGADDTAGPVSLRLEQISAPLKAPAGPGPLLLLRENGAKDQPPWLRAQRPDTGDFLLLLWRDAKAGTWDTARALALPDDFLQAPPGSVRFVNVSPARVGIDFGGEKLLLEAGKHFTRTVPSGQEKPFQVLLPDTTGNLKRLHGGVIYQNPAERTLVAIYMADGVARRLPLKVVVKREPVP